MPSVRLRPGGVPQWRVASTYLSLNLHLIFATKHRAPMIAKEWRAEFHAYMAGTVRGLGASSIAVGGIEDHVHILCRMKATHSVSDFMRDLKTATSKWASERYHAFGWQEGYAALSVSASGVESVRR